jgi:hypothetical protein
MHVKNKKINSLSISKQNVYFIASVKWPLDTQTGHNTIAANLHNIHLSHMSELTPDLFELLAVN